MFKQIRCFSLLVLGLIGTSAGAASFDCELARSPVEKMICADAAVSKLDEQLQVLYARAQKAGGTSASKDRQLAWLGLRNTCTSLDCLKSAYAVRLAELQEPMTETDFAGHWTIDLRTPQERQQGRECGMANFHLKQSGDRITGDHTFATTGCGRLNEGGDDTVKGIVIGSTAVLVVRSGRNDAIVFGKAIRSGKFLHWTTVDEIAPDSSEGDSPLILGKGILLRQNDPG